VRNVFCRAAYETVASQSREGHISDGVLWGAAHNVIVAVEHNNDLVNANRHISRIKSASLTDTTIALGVPTYRRAPALAHTSTSYHVNQPRLSSSTFSRPYNV